MPNPKQQCRTKYTKEKEEVVEIDATGEESNPSANQPVRRLARRKQQEDSAVTAEDEPMPDREIIDVDEENEDKYTIFSNAIKAKFKGVYLSKGVQEFISSINLDAEEDLGKTKTFTVNPVPFHLIPLYYVQSVIRSQPFQQLSQRSLPTKVQTCWFYDQELPTHMRFHLCHIQAKFAAPVVKTQTASLNAERRKIHTFFKNSFDNLTPDNNDTIERSLKGGETIYIFGLNNTGKILM